MTRVLALDINNGNTLWSTFVQANAVEIIPQEERLYVYGTSGGLDYLLDTSNGEVVEALEQTNRSEQSPSRYGIQGDIISNVAVTPSFVFALSKDGNLLRLNREAGQQETLVVFTNAPFVANRVDFPYYVTVDPTTNILFVYLGDSAQLYAFQLPNS